MKSIYLIFKQYSKHFIREIVIILFAAYLIYALTLAVTPIAYTFSLTNEVEASIGQNAVYFSPYDRVSTIINGFLNNSDEERKTMDNLLSSSLNSIDGVIGQGKTGELIFGNEDNYTRLIIYNNDMIKYTTLPLAQGKWFSTDNNKSQEVPVIIGGCLKNKYKINDVFQIDLQGKYVISLTCKVIAVLDETDTYFALRFGATSPSLDSLAIMNKWSYSANQKDSDAIIIAPSGYLPFSDPSDFSCGTLLFLDDKIDANSSAEALEDAGMYGHYSSIDSIAANQRKFDSFQYADEIILSIVLFLLNVFGLGGYTLLNLIKNEYHTAIYYFCGMSKGKAIMINIAATGLLVFVPALIMTLLSPKFLVPGSIVNHNTYIISLCVVILISAISNSIAIYRIAKNDPAKLMQMEG